MKDDIKSVIDEIVKLTFSRLQEVYDHRQESSLSNNQSYIGKTGCSRLVFPMYGKHRHNETRVSEQELRFAFVETFNMVCDEKHLDLFYSVETPTSAGTYSGFSKGSPRSDDSEGRSAEFDLVIHDKFLRRIALIEFKANNSDFNSHLKDFLKLNNPSEGNESVLRYFIEIVKSSDSGTISSLRKKVAGRGISKFFCYNLSQGGEDITSKILKYVQK